MDQEQRKCKCLRCSYEWPQRNSTKPKQCPYCKSPRWDVAKVKTITKPVVAQANELIATSAIA